VPDSAPIAFTLNQQQVTTDAPRSTLLIDWLHSNGFVGTKLGCGQGGCGACTVNVTLPGQPGIIRAVNSCLKPIGLLDGLAVTTIEGIPHASDKISGVAHGAGGNAPQCAHHKTNGSCGGCSRAATCGHAHSAPRQSHESNATSLCELRPEQSPSGASPSHPAVASSVVTPSAGASSLPDPTTVLAVFNGTQCGFCSAGMVMTVNQQIVSAPVPGSQPPSELDIEDLFSGNICRCTGFRPILCGFKAAYSSTGNKAELAETPALVLDEGQGYGNGYMRHKNVDVIDYRQPSDKAAEKAAPTKKMMKSSGAMMFAAMPAEPPVTAHTWSAQPRSWEELLGNLTQNVYAAPVKLVVGNTSYGVFPQVEWQGVGTFVDMRNIEGINTVQLFPNANTNHDSYELRAVLGAAQELKNSLNSKTAPAEQYVQIGAGVTIAQLMDFLGTQVAAASYSIQVAKLLKHWKRVAGHQVRNAGSVTGSLCMARYWNFASDSWLLLEGSGALVSLVLIKNGQQSGVTIPLDQFRALTNTEFVVTSIWLPLVPDNSVAPVAKTWFSSFRVAQRLQNAHPLVNGAFSWDGSGLPIVLWGNIEAAPVDPAQRPNLVKVGTAHYRLSNGLCQQILAAAMTGWPGDSLATLLEQVKAELRSVVGSASSEQGDEATRVNIAANLLYKFLVNGMNAPGAADSASTIFEARTARPSAGSQRFLVNRLEEPVSEPLVKYTGLKQTRGETMYCSSFRPPGCWHATFVTSWSATGIIAGYKPAAAALQDAVAFLKQQYGIECSASEFRLVDPSNNPEFKAANLLNGANYIYAPQNYPAPPVSANWPKSPVYQNLPTYLVAENQIMYFGQPIALLAGPDERAVTLAGAYLSTVDAGYLMIQPNPPKPILSVQESMQRKTMIVDGKFPTSTELVNTALYVPQPPTPGSQYQTYGSISNLSNGGVPDFSVYEADPDRYIVVEGDHQVPGQTHFYMETQVAVAMAPSNTAPEYAKAPQPQRKKCPEPAAPVTPAALDPLAAFEADRQAKLNQPPVRAAEPSTYMTLYASTQSVVSVQGQVATALDTSFGGKSGTHAVQLIAPQLGGGFGGKTVQSAYVARAASFLSRLLNDPAHPEAGRAVRFTLARDTDTQVIGGRHAMAGWFKGAVDRKTGKVLALAVEVHLDAGCNYDCSLTVGDTCLITSDSYMVPSIDQHTGYSIASRAWFTNKSSSTAFRAFGIVQSQHFVEMCMQKAGEQINFSPFLLRQTNLYPYREAAPFPQSPYYQDVKYASADAIWDEIDGMLAQTALNIRQLADARAELGVTAESVRKLADAPPPRSPVHSAGAGFDLLSRLIKLYNSQSSHMKMGLSVLPLKYGVGFDFVKLNLGEALISIDVNGVCTVHADGVEMGQGLDTKLRQIAALKLGINLQSVSYESNVNSKWFQAFSPDGYILPGTGASTGADLNGGAVVMAANSVVQWLESLLKDTPLWVEWEANGRRFYVPPRYDEQGRQISAGSNLWPQAVALLNQKQALPLKNSGLEFYESPGMEQLPMGFGPKKGRIAWYYNFAAAGVVSLLDSHTGESCVLSADLVYDAGISLNPAVDIGQCEGGFVQGLGYNTCEEVSYDQQSGQLTTVNTWLYKPPSTLEIPLQLNVRLWPLAGQVRSWQEEERRLQGAEAAPSAGLAARLALPHRDNRYRKQWLRLDPAGNLIDPYGVQSSKASGEPPLVLGNAVYYALRQAVQYARWARYQAAGRSIRLEETDVDLICPATSFNTFQAVNAPLLSDADLQLWRKAQLRPRLQVPPRQDDPFAMAFPNGGGN